MLVLVLASGFLIMANRCCTITSFHHNRNSHLYFFESAAGTLRGRARARATVSQGWA